MANANELLTENIDDWKDVGEIQNQVNKAEFGNRAGLFALEWNVTAEMNIQGVAALATDTYYLKSPQVETNANVHTWDNFFLPAGTFIKSIWVHTHEAKVGSGTITPFLGSAGSTDLTAISAAGVVDEVGAGVGWTPAVLASDTDFGVVIATNTVTAGGFTLFIEYYIANVG